MNRWILAIADDLTGALEIGAKFAAQGLASRIVTRSWTGGAPDVPVLVIDTETRHLDESSAANAVHHAATAALPFAPWLIYKKTDSTLRGHIAAELRALQQTLPGRSLVYAPAYPDMGRTVRGGRLFVDGIPVDQTAFASDALNPVLESNIRAMLGDIAAEVFDGESDEDVLAAARAVLAMEPPPIAAGPAALAGALAQCLPLPRATIRKLPRLSRCLVVNGSRHPASAAQIESAHFENDWEYFNEDCGGTGPERATRTGERIRQRIEDSPVDALVVFGGDTAFGIHSALGAHPFEAYGEVVPGVPISRSNGLFWITKAGGFGSPGILCDIRKRLT
jgi:uncharacterized protein YgbK (DUF1537 family)